MAQATTVYHDGSPCSLLFSGLEEGMAGCELTASTTFHFSEPTIGPRRNTKRRNSVRTSTLCHCQALYAIAKQYFGFAAESMLRTPWSWSTHTSTAGRRVCWTIESREEAGRGSGREKLTGVHVGIRRGQVIVGKH